MNRLIAVYVLIGFCFSLPVLADEQNQEALVRLQIKLQTILEMKDVGEITSQQAETSTNRILGDADVSFDTVMAAEGALANSSVQELTALQKFAGLVTFMNIVWVLGIGLVLVGGGILFGRFLRRVPPELYEFLGYVASLTLVFWGATLAPGVREYVTFTGMAMGCGGLALSWYIHKFDIPASVFFLICTVLLSVGAVTTDNSIAGFSAMITLISALGFSVIVNPLTYAFGFKDDSALARATSGGFIMIGLFVGLRMLGASIPQLQLFGGGALFMGSFVGYLGLLIASSRWYAYSRGYGVMQIITVIAGILALFLGSVFAIPELQKIGGTFFVLFLIEKFMDIPAQSVEGYAVVAVCTGGFLWVMIWFLKSNINTFAPYVFGF